MTSILLRAMFKQGDDKRDAGLTTPADIRRRDDILYGPEEAWQRLDVYRPAGAEGTVLPVIVSVHGGGWVYGDKERYQFYCMSLAQQGFAVVNFTYRLAPRFKFPAQIEDTDLVFRWVLENAAAYGFDRDRVFAVGDSAGAHLLALYCCACADPAFAQTLNVTPPEGFRPAAIALNCGVYDVGLGSGSSLNAKLMRDLLPRRGTKEELRTIRVLSHLTPGFPPSFVMTSSGDFLKEQAPLLTERLQKLGVPFEYRLYGDEEHMLGHVFHCDVRSEDAQRCNRDECEYFRSFCVDP